MENHAQTCWEYDAVFCPACGTKILDRDEVVPPCQHVLYIFLDQVGEFLTQTETVTEILDHLDDSDSEEGQVELLQQRLSRPGILHPCFDPALPFGAPTRLGLDLSAEANRPDPR